MAALLASALAPALAECSGIVEGRSKQINVPPNREVQIALLNDEGR